jgi:hypothetical protein
MLAHIMGIPVEEVLLPLVTGGAGAGALLFIASIVSRFCRR